ncbi:MAG: hypothetical protein ACOVLE_07585, partial [Pirellula staleyi]
KIRLFDATGAMLSDTPVPNLGDNSFQIVSLKAIAVRKMELVLSGGGAVAAIVSNRASLPIGPPQTTYFVADTNDTTYRYSSTGAAVGSFAMPASMNARGASTTSAGNPIWIVSEEGAKDKVYVFDTNGEILLGAWSATGVTTPEGIATDGNNIWIVDDARNRVFRYNSAASRIGGSLASSSSFNLASANQTPKGIATDGTRLYVVDSGSDKVFVYSLSGALLNSWGLDPANANASDVTLQNSDNGLVTVDATTRRAYYYPKRIPSTSGIQRVERSFALSGANTRPQGLADPATPINVGDLINGATTTAGELVEYAFNAKLGQRIFFDVSNTDAFSFNWKVTNPNGSVLFTNGFMSDQDVVVLPQTGAYTITVAGSGTRWGAFQFALVDVPAPTTTPFSIENVVAGSLTIPGQQAKYTFTGTAGQNLYLDVQNTDPFAFNWSMAAPNGSTVFNDALMRDLNTTTLPASGTYTITVDGTAESVGRFQFQLRNVPNPTTTAIAIEDMVTGGTTVPDQKQRFTFNATAGQKIFFDVQNTNIFGFNWRVDTPNGTNLFTDDQMRDFEPITMPATGKYTITVDGTDEFVGSFQFQLRNVPGPTTTQFNIGDVVDGAIAIPGQFAIYKFNGTSGQRLFFDVQNTNIFNFNWNVVTPNGATLFSDGFMRDKDPLILPETGSYTMTIDAPGDVVDAFHFQLINLPFVAPNPILLDQVVSGRISLPGEVDQYTFSGQAGQLVYFDVQEGSLFDLSWTLRNANGNVVFTDSFFRDRPTSALPTTGTYALTIDDSGDRVEPYRFQMGTLDPINFGQTVTGNIREFGKVEFYRFDAIANSPFSLDVIASESNSMRWELISPTGNFLLSNIATDVANFSYLKQECIRWPSMATIRPSVPLTSKSCKAPPYPLSRHLAQISSSPTYPPRRRSSLTRLRCK